MWLLDCLVSDGDLGLDRITCPTTAHCVDTTTASRITSQSPHVRWKPSLTRDRAAAAQLSAVHPCLLKLRLPARSVATHDRSRAGRSVTGETTV